MVVAVELCGPNYGPLDFRSDCVRSFWASLLPFTLVLILTLFSIPFIRPKLPFFLKTFVPLEEAEAEALVSQSEPNIPHNKKQPRPTFWRRSLFFVTLGLLYTFHYLSYFSYLLVDVNNPFTVALPSLLLALTWLYPVLRTTLKSPQTVPYDLFVLYTTLFSGAVLNLGGVFYDTGVSDAPWPSVPSMVAMSLNLVATGTLTCIVLSMPLALPGRNVNPDDI
ncbi:hypothetical protein H0H93_006772, partial [Arthromyces matolae]